MIDKLSSGNIIWFPFEKNKSVFVYSEASDLCAMEDSLEKYDYIIMNRLETVDNPAIHFSKIKEYLNPEGHILLSFTNRLGLQFFCGERDPFTGRVFDGIENYQNYLKEDFKAFEGRLYSRVEIEEMLDAVGLTRRKYYSILPGLLMPQQIYAQDVLPNEELAIRYSPLHEDPGTVFMNQGFLFDEIAKNGLLHSLANAYLFDVTMDGDLGDISSVTTSLDRGKKFATATIIHEDDTVEKKALYKEGEASLEQLCLNTKELQSCGLSVVEMEKKDGVIKMPFIHHESALTVLRRSFYEDFDMFLKQLDRFVELILKSSEAVDFVDEKYSESGTVYKKVYIDLVPLNAFYHDGDFLFFDQEFVIENVPINALIVRAIDITYIGDRSMEQIYPREKLFERYGITSQIDLLREIGNDFIYQLRCVDKLKDFRQQHWVDASRIAENRNRLNYTKEELEQLYEFPMNHAEGKRVYIFGTGKWATLFVARFADYCNIVGAIDNNEEKQGKLFAKNIPIVGIDRVKEDNFDQIKVIVCIKHCTMIVQQLKRLGIENFSLYDPNITWSDEETYCREHENLLTAKNTTNNSTTQQDGEVGHYLKGYVAGVFDLFHVGHLNVLRRAKEHCDYLIVGVVSDEQAAQGKVRGPYINENERLEIVRACKYVDEAFILPRYAAGTQDVYRKYHFDAQFSGSDYENNPYWLEHREWLRERGSDIIFFPYTDSVSSTKIKRSIEASE